MTQLDGNAARLAVSDSASASEFLHDAMVGLRSAPKRLSAKYLYDTRGSVLFDAICDLPEYYVTRTEREILVARAAEIVRRLTADGSTSVRLVEPGAGSSTKTRLLLRALGERCIEYVPVDIAGEHLEKAASALRRDLPWLRVTPFVADFSRDLSLPKRAGVFEGARTVVFFPGSTLGNFDPAEARRLLTRFRQAADPDGLVLIGIDLKKDPAELHRAYNDAQGVTAAFNQNVLHRMNSELGADFDVDAFRHYAFYDPRAGRIEMHLVSARRQQVHLGGEIFEFDNGESICTEHSYKFDLRTFERLARGAGLELTDAWLDDDERFAVTLLGIGPPRL